MHTTFSDGTDHPEELIANVRKAGIDLFSITDHDSIRAGIAVPPMIETAGTGRSPAFIRGIEFSCKDEKGKYHILGYGYDPDVPGIRDVVDTGHALRMKKTEGRLQFLEEKFGFTFPEEEIRKLLSRDNPGKPHIALMMVEAGYAADMNEAITRYIDKKKFETVYVRPEKAIRGILKSGGIPVLAHPACGDGKERILGEEMDQRLRHLMDFGLAGVEGYYSGFSPGIRDEILAFAEKYDLYVTAGSDYHGRNRKTELGRTNLDDMSEAPAGLMRFLRDADIISPGGSSQWLL